MKSQGFSAEFSTVTKTTWLTVKLEIEGGGIAMRCIALVLLLLSPMALWFALCIALRAICFVVVYQIGKTFITNAQQVDPEPSQTASLLPLTRRSSVAVLLMMSFLKFYANQRAELSMEIDMA